MRNSITVLPQNITTGNHCVKPNDWRLRSRRPISFSINGVDVTVDSMYIKKYIDNNHRCFRCSITEEVNPTTGEVVQTKHYYCLIPDEYIIQGKR